MKRVIVDLDVGTDDAVALLLLLHADKTNLIKLEAITCVNGNTNVKNVAKNVIRLLEAAKRTDIPVYVGAHESLILPMCKNSFFHGFDGFGDLKYDHEPNMSLIKEEAAPVFLGRTVVENPNEICILALGPLTNLALAVKLFDDFRISVKEVHIMGGNYKGVGNITRTAEFNFYIDPEAAHIVLERLKCPMSIVTWETTREQDISMDWRFNVLGKIENPILNLITLAEKSVYKTRRFNWLPCDAFLVAAFLYPDKIIKKQTNYHATVELHGSITRGQMVLDHLREIDDNITIVETIDNENFKNCLMDAVKGTM